MNQLDVLRHDLLGKVEELRSTLHDIGDQDLPPANVVSNARDRPHTISALTGQTAGPALTPQPPCRRTRWIISSAEQQLTAFSRMMSAYADGAPPIYLIQPETFANG